MAHMSMPTVSCAPRQERKFASFISPRLRARKCTRLHPLQSSFASRWRRKRNTRRSTSRGTRQDVCHIRHEQAPRQLEQASGARTSHNRKNGCHSQRVAADFFALHFLPSSKSTTQQPFGCSFSLKSRNF